MIWNYLPLKGISIPEESCVQLEPQGIQNKSECLDLEPQTQEKEDEELFELKETQNCGVISSQNPSRHASNGIIDVSNVQMAILEEGTRSRVSIKYSTDFL